MRLTADNIQKILEKNEGYKSRTYYKSRNSEEENLYTIIGGVLEKRSIGKSSFDRSGYDETIVCDLDQTRRFLRNNINDLKLNI